MSIDTHNDRPDRLTIDAAITRVRTSRDRGVAWLLAHIAADGEPVAARERNGWGRVPWALALSGESERGAAVVSWAERGQLAGDGGFAPGPALGGGHFTAYPLSQFAMGCWLLERYTPSLKAMHHLRLLQDPQTGGLPIAGPSDRATDVADLLCTAQVGLAAVLTGQDDIADLAYRWTADLWAMQPRLAEKTLFTFRRGDALLTEPPDALAWYSVTRFDQPRQTYYTPGIAAAFLAAYAQRRGVPTALTLAGNMLRLNIEGCTDQFTDLHSVQACKFGWGAAVMFVAEPDGDWLSHVLRMGEWFIDRQAPDGSWTASSFLVPEPTDFDRLSKTAEHVMEVNAILAALGTARGRVADAPVPAG